MSNRILLNAVKFEYANGTVCYGYTLSDDWATTFENNAESMITDDMELLRYAKKTADACAESTFDFMCEMQKGITINDQYYDYSEIKGVIDE